MESWYCPFHSSIHPRVKYELFIHYSFCLCSADCRTQLSTFEMEDQKLSDNSFQLIIAYHAMAVHCHKKTPVSDKSLHSFQNPNTHCIAVSKMKVRFHRCVLLCTVEIWVHNMVRSCYSKIKSYKTSSTLLYDKPLLLPRHLGRTLYFIFILGFLGPMGPSTLAPARKLLYRNSQINLNKRF